MRWTVWGTNVLEESPLFCIIGKTKLLRGKLIAENGGSLIEKINFRTEKIRIFFFCKIPALLKLA
jgi:hypothetical protein